MLLEFELRASQLLRSALPLEPFLQPLFSFLREKKNPGSKVTIKSEHPTIMTSVVPSYYSFERRGDFLCD
jgi:hypothetical protein